MYERLVQFGNTDLVASQRKLNFLYIEKYFLKMHLANNQNFYTNESETLILRLDTCAFINIRVFHENSLGLCNSIRRRITLAVVPNYKTF